jgi:Ferrochelatase
LRFAVTFLRRMKLSSMPSGENPRPTLRPPSRSGPATGRRSGNTARRVIRPGEHTAILLKNTPELENNMRKSAWPTLKALQQIVIMLRSHDALKRVVLAPQSSQLGDIAVIAPGFAADSLETLEEIAIRYAGLYRSHGGGELCCSPALNDSPRHIKALASVCGVIFGAGRPVRVSLEGDAG